MIAREIIEERSVSTAIDRAISKYPRIQEEFEGLKWRLSRAPEDGYCIPGSKPPFYIFKIEPPIEEVPLIAVLYQYDENQVKIRAIRIIPQSTRGIK